MITIDYQDRRPLYEQIAERFSHLIYSGVLEPDSRMPSVRKLAIELSINPNTIQRAYAMLEQEGLIYPVKGRGNYVCPDKALIETKRKRYERDFLDMVVQGKKAGYDREYLMALLNRVYDEEVRDDKDERYF